MRVYLTTDKDLSEIKKYEKDLALLSENDVFKVICLSENASIPIESFMFLSGLKCKPEFMQGKACNIVLAFELGKICANNPVDIKILSSTDELIEFKSLETGGTATKTRKKKAKDTEAKSEEFSMPCPIQEDTQALVENKPSKRGRKKKEEGNKEEDDFEKSFNKLTSLLNSLKTEEFTPSAHINGIVRATKQAIKDKIPLSESFEAWFPDKKDVVISVFKGHEDELINIIKNMNDEY